MSVSNLWLGGGLFLLRILVMGFFWSASGEADYQGRVNAVLRRSAHLLFSGLVMNLLPVLILGLCMLWTPLLDWCSFAVLAGMGAWRCRKAGKRTKRHLIVDSAAALLLIGCFALALVLPGRSEWLAGGWDPGMYQNNSVAIATRGGIADFTDSVYGLLSAEERVVLSRGDGNYREILPAVPINCENGNLPLYFFHLTSVFGAWLFRCGGLALLVRQPMIIGWLLVVPFMALLRLLTGAVVCTMAALLVMLTSPLWWYHQAIPTSEMLQIMLFSGVIFFYLDGQRQSCRQSWLSGALLFLGCLNRIDFSVFAGFFLVLGVAADAARQPAGMRVGIKDVGLLLACLWTGILFNVLFATETIKLLQQKDHVLTIVTSGLAVFSFVSLAGGLLVKKDHWPQILINFVRVTGFLAVLGYLFLTLISFNDAAAQFWLRVVETIDFLSGPSSRYFKTLAFTGRLPMAMTWLGGLVLFGMAGRSNKPMLVLGWGLLVSVSILFAAGQIAGIYPWALRRYFPFLLPTMMLFSVVPLWMSMTMREFRWRMPFRVTSVLLLALALLSGARRSIAAAEVSDYKGMGAFFNNELMDLFTSDDVIVVDSPSWGTPMLLSAGLDVVNGKLLWNSSEEKRRVQFLRALRRIEQTQGRRVRWLTTTGYGIDLYKFKNEPPELLTEGPLFYHYETVIHSHRADHFSTRDHRAEFRIYTGVPHE
jgi:hypothetical protein